MQCCEKTATSVLRVLLCGKSQSPRFSKARLVASYGKHVLGSKYCRRSFRACIVQNSSSVHANTWGRPWSVACRRTLIWDSTQISRWTLLSLWILAKTTRWKLLEVGRESLSEWQAVRHIWWRCVRNKWWKRHATSTWRHHARLTWRSTKRRWWHS